MRMKARLATAATALALLGGGIAIAAPAAHAAPTPIGGCQGSVSLGTITPSLSDQTQVGVAIKTKLFEGSDIQDGYRWHVRDRHPQGRS